MGCPPKSVTVRRIHGSSGGLLVDQYVLVVQYVWTPAPCAVVLVHKGEAPFGDPPEQEVFFEADRVLGSLGVGGVTVIKRVHEVLRALAFSNQPLGLLVEQEAGRQTSASRAQDTADLVEIVTDLRALHVRENRSEEDQVKARVLVGKTVVDRLEGAFGIVPLVEDVSFPEREVRESCANRLLGPFNQFAKDVETFISSRRLEIVGERVGHAAKPAAHVKNMCVRLQVGQLDEVAKEPVRDAKDIAATHGADVFVSGGWENRFDEVDQNASVLSRSQRSERDDRRTRLRRLQAIQAGTHPKMAPASPVEMGMDRFDIRAGEPHCDLNVRKLRASASHPEALDTPCTESRSPSLERQCAVGNRHPVQVSSRLNHCSSWIWLSSVRLNILREERRGGDHGQNSDSWQSRPASA